MCGIMGYTGTRPALELLLKGLRRLEYRGYDSAGVAFFRGGHLEIQKAEGKLDNLEKRLAAEDRATPKIHAGMGHTRWATHGKPTTQNAHPHQTGHLVLVHNGIIENYQEIKKMLIAKGVQPKSETDSELFGYLVLEEMEKGRSFPDAVRKSFSKIHGACSILISSEKEPDIIIGVRNGSPLVCAQDPKGGTFLASDAQPLVEYSKEIYFLEPGEMVIASPARIEFFDLASGESISKASVTMDWSAEKLSKQGYSHYMLKEIYEQPTALVDTMNLFLDRLRPEPFAFLDHPGASLLKKFFENAQTKGSTLHLVACGTAWHAAQVGKYWIEKFSGIPVQVELASEFRYREVSLRPGSLVLGVSQSGETADTLAALRQARAKGMATLAVTNVRGSSISREVDATYYMATGPEIGVAATKTYLGQLVSLFLISGYLGFLNLSRAHDSEKQKELESIFSELLRLPHGLSSFLSAPSGAKSESEETLQEQVRSVAKKVQKAQGYFFIGRGNQFPVALEGALKLKEIAYVHAEGYAAGELKHGPIAMIDSNMCVVVLAPQDRWRDKTVSNLEEVRARGAQIVSIGCEGDEALKELSHHFIGLPKSMDISDELLPFAVAPVMQLFSYELAILKGTDVDQPRNLAKSVTVE